MSDDAASTEPVDLTAEERAAIDGMYLRIANSTYYELLGVKPDADRKGLRDAYFALSQQFHPDSFFGRKMGPWKARLEAIFRECTQAYEILGNKKRRADYDATIGLAKRPSLAPQAPSKPATQRPRPASDASASSPAPAAAAGSPPSAGGFDLEGFLFPPESPAAQKAAQAAQHQPKATPAPAAARPAQGPPPKPTPAPAPAPAPVPKRAPLDEAAVKAQRDALARRLLGLRGATGSAPPATSTSPLESLQHQQHQQQQLARTRELEERVENLRQTAMESEKKGDFTSALNALNVAAGLVPERAEVRSELEALTRRQHDHNAKKAEQEARGAESTLDWKGAARHWQTVLQWRPQDPLALERAAFSLWKANAELPRAADLARRAVQMRPESLSAQVTLANVFLAGGLRASAEAAYAAALKLDPSAASVKDLEKKLKG